VLVCDACDLRIEGYFAQNEFAVLGPEDLHLLRIFVRYEGRIRDMESALGLSYPTIKLRLAELRRKLALAPAEADAGATEADAGATEAEEPQAPAAAEPNPGAAPSPEPAQPSQAAREVLAELEAGKISFDEAMGRMRGKSRT
jgi:hypothetical protein